VNVTDPLGLVGSVVADKYLIQSVIGEGGFGFQNANVNNYLNAQSLIGLAGLQQGEIGTLQGRGKSGVGRKAGIGVNLQNPGLAV
jgi:hypothetical protein